MPMTFEQLRVFTAVAEQMSFTRAAEALYLSQPAVSQHIQGLERHFQVTLIERKGRKLELSQAGRKLLAYAHRIMREAAEATTALSELTMEVHGKLQLCTSETIGSYLLPSIIGQFVKLYPHVQVSLRFKSAPEVISALVNGEIELALLEEVPHARYHEQVVRHFYRTGEVVLIVAPDHPFARRSVILPSELLEVPLIVRQAADRTRVFWTERLYLAGVHPDQLRVAFELDNTEGIKRAVMAGLGAGFVSTYAVTQELSLGLLHTVRIEGVDMARPLWALTPARYQLPKRVDAFVELLKQVAPD